MVVEPGCTNKEIKDLLPWYVSDNLSEKEKIMVEQHLDQCTWCANEVKNIRWISKGFLSGVPEGTSEHINSRLLTIYSESPNDIKKDIIKRIENHLEKCPQCKHELDILYKVNKSLEPLSTESFGNSIYQKVYEFIAGLFLKPAFAYVLVLLLLYPAWLGLYEKTGQQNSAGPFYIENIYVLEPTGIRGPERQLKEIDLKDSPGFFALSFVIPINNPENPEFTAVIVNSDNKITWNAGNLTFLDEYGTVILICPRKYFPADEYRLIVSEKQRLSPEIKDKYTFLFKIVSKDQDNIEKK